MDNFIHEICIALGLDRDGDIFKAMNTLHGVSVEVFIQEDTGIIKVIKSND